MSTRHIAIISILSIMLVAGCTSLPSRGLSLTLQADPSTVFSKSSTTLHIDVDNQNTKSIDNVVVELFDTGLLQGEKCSKFFPRLLPYEFQTISCKLDAPHIDEASVQTEVNTRVSFDNEFSADQVFELMDENEYQQRVAAGSYEAKPGNYVYSDKNIAIEIEFSEGLPLVIRPGKKYFVYFTITNSGDGFIGNINPRDFIVNNENILDCPPAVALSPVGKQFPRIACEIKAPIDFLGGRGFRNSDFLMHLKYNYELRNMLRINVIR